MDDRFNTIAGWTLFSGIVALGLSSVSGHMFRADKPERPEKMGYAIAGVVSSEHGAAAEVPIETLLASADPAKGEAVFKKCASCHTANSGGANGIGPNLYAILGDSIGTGRGGFAFSDDLKAKGGKWDFTSLNHWLANPKAMAAGTKMTFAGLEVAQDRANIIAWLNTQGSNLPLPKAPAAVAPAVGPISGPADGKPAAAPSEAAKK
jgi:cytochrome c